MRRSNMKKTEAFKEAYAVAMDRYDYILEEVEFMDFVEIIGKIGGDVERIRIYEDGMTVYK